MWTSVLAPRQSAEIIGTLGAGSKPSVPSSPAGGSESDKSLGHRESVAMFQVRTKLTLPASRLHQLHGLLEVQVGALPKPTCTTRSYLRAAATIFWPSSTARRSASPRIHPCPPCTPPPWGADASGRAWRPGPHRCPCLSNNLTKIFACLGVAPASPAVIQIGLVNIAHRGHFHSVVHEVLHCRPCPGGPCRSPQPDAVICAQNLRRAHPRHRQAHTRESGLPAS